MTKKVFGRAACAVCCGVPMLVVAGAVSLVAAATAGLAAGVVAMVAVTMLRLVQRHDRVDVWSAASWTAAAAGLGLARTAMNRLHAGAAGTVRAWFATGVVLLAVAALAQLVGLQRSSGGTGARERG